MNVVSLVGRPNTGKSALFNRLVRKRVAIVFDQPGVTRDRVTREVELNGRRLMLVDTGRGDPRPSRACRRGLGGMRRGCGRARRRNAARR